MASDPLWYKNAVFYEVDVETFYDSNGDGVGDFQGLIRRLDYVVDLGVTCLWLTPFYVSPNRDNGYDIADYCAVDPRLGTLADFAALVRAAESRGLRVITDLVVNHTSNQHPWFQSARRDLDSPYREYYVWTKNPPPPDPDLKLLFPGVENTTWCYDEVAGAFYWHRFYHHEPDLNNANPSVREEIQKIMGFWLDLGSSGFRVDAAPFMIRKKGIEGTTLDDPHLILREMRALLSSRRADAVLMAEADGNPDELAAYFGADDEMHLLLNFWMDNFAFLALAREQAEPLSGGLRRLPDKPFAGQWANFLRNLDELDLERLTDSQRAEVFCAFAAKERMQIYGRGTRRRLAPMLADRRRLELAFSLLFTLPGSPVVVYGDEIGLGEDLSLEERNSVRTPMQWSSERNAGFSTASSERLIRPVVTDGDFGYERVNVAAQEHDLDSLLQWVRRLTRLRRSCSEIGLGDCRVVETGDPTVSALRFDWEGWTLVAVHNFSREPRQVAFPVGAIASSHWSDLWTGAAQPLTVAGVLELELTGHGYHWLRGESGPSSNAL